MPRTWVLPTNLYACFMYPHVVLTLRSKGYLRIKRRRMSSKSIKRLPDRIRQRLGLMLYEQATMQRLKAAMTSLASINLLLHTSMKHLQHLRQHHRRLRRDLLCPTPIVQIKVLLCIPTLHLKAALAARKPCQRIYLTARPQRTLGSMDQRSLTTKQVDACAPKVVTWAT